jgi:predicted transposase/invertase (TIGR01784 family)
MAPPLGSGSLENTYLWKQAWAMQFVDVKNDIAFRKIFGNEQKKVILISFLNAVLGLEGEAKIVDVEIVNPYQLPIIQYLKASILDLKARDAKGNIYLIEMQVAEPEGLDKRLLYYLSKEYASQIDSGEKYTELKPVIFIGIFDFAFTADPHYINHHAVCNVVSGERVIKDMDFFFIELPKFTKTMSELTDIMEKWVYFIKEAQNLDQMPTELGDEGLIQAYHDAAKFSWTKDELNAYDYASIREQDERGIKALAEKRAEERGMELKDRAFVQRLYVLGKTIPDIVDLTGLSTGRVMEILHDLGIEIS